MIYFVQSIGGGSIMIVTTIRLSERLKQLEELHGTSFRVIAVTDGSYAEERSLHEKFRHLDAEIEGLAEEWFYPGDDLIDFMRFECQPWYGEEEKTIATRASIEGSDEFGVWLREFADHVRLPLATLIENALGEYAENHGYKPPLPKR